MPRKRTDKEARIKILEARLDAARAEISFRTIQIAIIRKELAALSREARHGG